MEQLTTPKTRVDQAYEGILNSICAGSLRPGERLLQHNIAKRLNMSRQPITQALLVLKDQGFLRETGRRGLVVAPFEPALLEAIYDFRSAVEPLAVELATRRLNPTAISAGRRLLARGNRFAARGDTVGLARVHAEFHLFLYKRSGNSLILNTMTLSWQHLRRCTPEIINATSDGNWSEHEVIFELMVAGNAQGAAAEMRRHIVDSYARATP
jgi:DNA-binding GntR family transcriptional regulator